MIAVAFSPDGRTVLTGSRDETARLWPLPAPLEGEADTITALVQTLTGTELSPSGGTRVLDATALQQRKSGLRDRDNRTAP